MKLKISEIFKALILTGILLVVLELFSSTILPIFGIKSIRLSFNILIILFLALRLNSSALPYCILTLQWVHSVFSIEGWAIGTIAGIIISLLVNALKDIIHMNTKASTMMVVQIFQIVWFILVSLMLGFKTNNFGIFSQFFSRFLLQSVILSILSPFLFILLAKIWKKGNSYTGAGVSI
jgi:hypothetical protein